MWYCRHSSEKDAEVVDQHAGSFDLSRVVRAALQSLDPMLAEGMSLPERMG